MRMIKDKSSLRNLRHRYRLTIMNEDSFEEITSFSMTRRTVYFVMSFFFVVLVGLTVVLIAFTPLKYYIPGYGTSRNETGYVTLKQRADSLENEIRVQKQYTDGIKSILKGTEQSLDTTLDSMDSGY